jgi:CubicO group peptidase (beta-lactamase class C family)
MVIKNGKPIFKKAYGLANLEDKTPATLATQFRWPR